MTLYQSRYVAVLCTAQQIAFPMARNRTVFHFRGPFADRDGMTARVSKDVRMLRAAYAALGSQVQSMFWLTKQTCSANKSY
jgi:hypothetical protein